MKPILFNTEMVQAILDGRKTVTRRLLKPKSEGMLIGQNKNSGAYFEKLYEPVKPKYNVGDVLYVRETFGSYGDGTQVLYKADFEDNQKKYVHDDGVHICDIPKWKPSIHMPKEAARIFLKVTNVRCERTNNMSVSDMVKEGTKVKDLMTTTGLIEYRVINRFETLWNATIKEEWQKLENNPWVWVYEFELTEREV